MVLQGSSYTAAKAPLKPIELWAYEVRSLLESFISYICESFRNK